jgi:hypothetical protein
MVCHCPRIAVPDNRDLVYKRRIYLPGLSGKDAEAAEVSTLTILCVLLTDEFVQSARVKAQIEEAERAAAGSGGGVYKASMHTSQIWVF